MLSLRVGRVDCSRERGVLVTAVSRAEHLAWCKTRALAYVEQGDLHNAFASLMSDLRKHQETENHGAVGLGMMLMLGGMLNTAKDMRDFIKGCN